MTRVVSIDGQTVTLSDADFAARYPDAPPATPSVPQRVSAVAAKLSLLHGGLLDQTKAAIAQAGGDAQIWFEDADHWDRGNSFVVQFAAALNLTANQVDSLFQAAAQIDAATA